MARGFATSTAEEIDKLIEDKDSENTKRSTKTLSRVFEGEKIKEPDNNKELANVLKSFYVEARKKEGSSYSVSSLKTLRFALNRHFKAIRGVHIMTDEFGEASKAFGAKCAQLKKDARAKVQHKPPIPDAALKKTL